MKAMLHKCLVWVCVAMMICAVATADGILPTITNNGILPSIQETAVISFGVELGVYPNEMGTLADGRWHEVYTGVTTEQYNAFSVLLGQQGYTVASSSVSGTFVSVVLARDNMSIDFTYDSSKGMLTMTYPVNVKTQYTTGSVSAGATQSATSLISTGDYVSFGRYPQATSYAEPILWTVLQVRNDSAILISKYVLDARIYGDTGEWKNSMMRSWLNNEFVASAFTSNEQLVLVKDALNDYVTVPTKDEALSMNTVSAEPTLYARANGVLPKDRTNASYITQTPYGNSYVYYIGPDATANRMASNTICGVRPVISVSLSKINVASGRGSAQDPWICQPQ